MFLNLLQGPEFDVTILALMEADQSSSSRRHLFPSPEAKTVALTRAKKSVLVVGRGQEMEASDDAKDILSFANSQYEDATRNVNSISSLPLDRSINDVVNTLNSALMVKAQGGAAGPSWGRSFYSAPSSNYATPRVSYGIGAVVGGGDGGRGGVGGVGGFGYQPVC